MTISCSCPWSSFLQAPGFRLTGKQGRDRGDRGDRSPLSRDRCPPVEPWFPVFLDYTITLERQGGSECCIT